MLLDMLFVDFVWQRRRENMGEKKNWDRSKYNKKYNVLIKYCV